jgi:hypothetical protein
MRLILTLVALFIAMPSWAIDTSQWIEVKGGDWHPSREALTELDAALPAALLRASVGKGSPIPWTKYRFQYQGQSAWFGNHYVRINALCQREGTSDQLLATEWVKALDGGTCYFSAKFDPTSHRIFDVEVNGLS